MIMNVAIGYVATNSKTQHTQTALSFYQNKK